MEFDTPLLTAICKAPGAPGFEQPIRKLVLDTLKGLVDEVRVDNLGSIVALKKGRCDKQSVMAAAHMDEIGFIVTHIDDEGFVRFDPLGGFDPKTLTAQRVILHGTKDIIGVMGCKPTHIMTPEERNQPLKLKDYFIDTGLPKKKLEKIIEIGTPVTRYSELLELGDCINVKSLDNRASVFILLETLKKLKEEKQQPAYDFYAVFTVQEEVGLRGAQASTLDIQPHWGIGLDTTVAFDSPGAAPQEKVTALGKGAAIKIMDSSTICDYRMVNYMKKIAKKESINWQPEILSAGGTDTASLQRMTPGGSIAGAISLPTRYIHQSIEMAHKKDFIAAINLLAASVCQLDEGDWEF